MRNNYSVCGMSPARGYNPYDNDMHLQCPLRIKKKGSFTAKFRNEDSKSLAYVVENFKWVEKTFNTVFNMVGIDYKLEFSSQKYLMGSLHAAAGIYDYTHSEDKSVLPIINTFMYNVNLHTNALTGHHPLIQCSIEVGFSFVKNAGFLDLPGLTLLSNTLTGLICLNKEYNSSYYQEPIDLALNIVKTSLYYLSPLRSVQAVAFVKNFWLTEALVSSAIPTIDYPEYTPAKEKQILSGITIPYHDGVIPISHDDL